MSSDTRKKSSAEVERGYGTKQGDRVEARRIIDALNQKHGTKFARNGAEFKRVRRALSGVTYEEFGHGDLDAAEELLGLD